MLNVRTPFITALLLPLALTLSIAPIFATRIKHITADQAQQGNPATAAFDTDPETKWAAQGQGRWIQFEFYDPKDLNKIGIGFAHSERDYAFDIRTSEDGEKWSDPSKFRSRAEDGIRFYKIDPTQARAVRITVFGSDKNDWANIHTIQVRGVAPGGAQ